MGVGDERSIPMPVESPSAKPMIPGAPRTVEKPSSPNRGPSVPGVRKATNEDGRFRAGIVGPLPVDER